MKWPKAGSLSDRIFLRGLAVRAHVGPERGSTALEVDLELFIDLRRAASTDCLSDTVNYADIAGKILSALEAPRFDNLAAVATAAADAVLSVEATIRELSLTIRNLRPAIDGSIGELGISVTRKQRPVLELADDRRRAEAI
ncbi:MAG: dihydroneopterin aldolase [Rhizobiales bacterium]|nr:dihydroneopterin aldolase [Hyphomicrobiales bacterium]